MSDGMSADDEVSGLDLDLSDPLDLEPDHIDLSVDPELDLGLESEVSPGNEIDLEV